jgi:DnaJ-class molecular chaperone
MTTEVECPTCDGTGEVHSHNPICWTCHGNKTTTPEKAAQARAAEKATTFRARTWDYE